MRRQCLECVAKHVAAAQELLQETFLGYPEFIHKVQAQLDQASAEMLRRDIKFAIRIRETRLKIWDSWWLYRAGQMTFDGFVDEIPSLDDMLEDIDGMLVEELLGGGIDNDNDEDEVSRAEAGAVVGKKNKKGRTR